MIVAIDGPAGSGKGTITKLVAEKCNLVYIDTGATYRCLALACIENKINYKEEDKVVDLLKRINIDFDTNGHTFLNGKDVSERIRDKDVTEIVSPISSINEVREILVDLQRKMSVGKNVIMEGRDITTVVFPDANYKFYLDASVEERAKRRYKQQEEKGINMSYKEIIESIKARDYNDMNKPVGKLQRTNDQIYIDSSNMSINEVVDKIINEIGSDK